MSGSPLTFGRCVCWSVLAWPFSFPSRGLMVTHEHACSEGPLFDDSVNSANLGVARNLPRPRRNRRIGLSFLRLSFDV